MPVANPRAVGGFHKPFIVMDPDHPNQAAKIDDRYCLLVVSFKDGHKRIQRAWSGKLAGPWTFEPQAIIPTGAAGDFDGKHTDAVSGYYFPRRKEFLYFYMGYPRQAQPRKISRFGSAQAVATQKLDEKVATKRGVILQPYQQSGHWAAGWVGGLQLLRGHEHRWVAVVNASPTAVDPGKSAVWTEEPPPSQAGFAWCDEQWPVTGWHFAAADRVGKGHSQVCPGRGRRLQSLAAVHPHLARRARRALLQQRLLRPGAIVFESK